MKFLKNMMSGKRHHEDSMNIDDVAAMIDDVDSENESDVQSFNDLAAIQARIKDTQSGKVKSPMQKQTNAGRNDAVEHFADMVDDIREPKPAPGIGAYGLSQPKPRENDAKVEMSPVMTDDDFSRLDDELAQMSEELEELEALEMQDRLAKEKLANDISEPDAVAPQSVEVLDKTEPVTDADVKPDAPEEEPGIAMQSKPVSAPRSATIHISEMQGGASMPEKEMETAVSVPEVAKSIEPSPMVVETQSVGEIEEQAPASVAPEAAVEAVAEVPVQEPHIIEVPAPAAGRSGRRAGRVKTRLLGFEHANGTNSDPFVGATEPLQSNQVNFPVGWIVVVDGPGLGTAFALFNGVSQIGRGEDQAIRLDFGDSSVSRNNHAAIAYDNEQHTFYLGHGGKANLVRLNDRPVLSTEEISDSDIIRVGETKLRFVAFCGAEFNWDADDKDDQSNAAIA